jgi:hypothetical protein
MAVERPNVPFVLADQLRASSLPIHGEGQIQTPHIDRLAEDGVVLTNAVATCAVCTPYRAMLLTGRHPQTTGHVIHFLRTRHDETGIGDVLFADCAGSPCRARLRATIYQHPGEARRGPSSKMQC